MTVANMQVGRWCLAGLLLCYSLWVMAAEMELRTPRDWLQAMGEAMQHLDYEATVAYSRDNRIQTLRLAHTIRDGKVYERLQALDGAQREVVREADKVRCYFPDRRILIVEYRRQSHSLFNNALPKRWDEQERFYRFQLGQRVRVAGREAQEIIVESLDEHRYGRQIWIDVATRLPLKFALLDQQGKVLESYVVTGLEVGEGVQVGTEQIASHADWKVLDRKEETADQRWQLTRLPQGFQEIRRSRRPDPVDGTLVDHILISDGLASVSVYIKRDGGEAFDPGNLRLGAVSVYSRRLDGYLITVLGDVPLATVRLIGEGVRQAQP